MSGRQLKGQALLDQVTRLRAAYPPGVRLILEITESVLVQDDGESLETLRALRGLGVGLAIDDFGTGYSSIAYLRHLPVDVLKIDRSFVADVARDERAAALVDAIAAMATALELSMVAEGIENAEQLRALQALGCRLGQGYWFARPMAAEEAERFLRSGVVDVGPGVVAAPRLGEKMAT